jgi:UDP-perosamine 4-acetyltransferase
MIRGAGRESPTAANRGVTVHVVTGPTQLRVLVIGAQGHARVCIEALRDDPAHLVVAAVSHDGTGITGLGVDVIGADDDLQSATQRAQATTGFVAIGVNEIRSTVIRRWDTTGLPLCSAVSRHAIISPTATIADGVALLPGAVVNAGTSIGRGSIVNTNASVDHDCEVGAAVHIAPGVAIGGGVTIGDGALVGIGARILPNLTIGDGATIGGGAVVIDDVPPGTTVVGVPARTVRR